MYNIQKKLIVWGLSVLGFAGIIALLKTTMGWHHHERPFDRTVKDIDRTIQESNAALAKAMAHAQHVFEYLKSRAA